MSAKAYLYIFVSMVFILDTAAQEKVVRPNILWISVEDLSPMLRIYGDSTVETPHIERLSKEGILFRNAFSTSGVCAPSRSSIISGMHPVSIGTHNMRTGRSAAFRNPDQETYKADAGRKDVLGRNVPEYAAVPPPSVKVFTEYLRASGYYTTNSAKTDYQFNCPITAWDEIGKEADYRNRQPGQPFFAVFNLEVTHESNIFKKKGDTLLVRPEKVKIPRYFPDIPVVRADIARAYSNLRELDQQVGRLLNRLKEEGLLEKTIVFFWSDHGGPFLRQKRAVGNSGLRVPLIIRFPNAEKAGTTVADVVSLMDLGPTVLSLAGIQPPPHMQGKAFLGPFRSSKTHTYAFGSADRFEEAFDMSRSALDGRFVYIRNFHPELPLVYRLRYREQIDMTRALIQMDEKGELSGDPAYIFMKTKPQEELYDLESDPDEVHNLASFPQYKEKLSEMRTALDNWQKNVKDLGFVPESDLVNRMWPGGIQPLTDSVRFNLTETGLQLTSPTEGASIGYQTDDEIGGRKWKIYTVPLRKGSFKQVAARAVRLGYKTSGVTLYK